MTVSLCTIISSQADCVGVPHFPDKLVLPESWSATSQTPSEPPVPQEEEVRGWSSYVLPVLLAGAVAYAYNTYFA